MRVLCFLLVSYVAFGGQSRNSAELSSRDEPAEFKARVNLVTVPVVVRDDRGRAIGNLRKDDFQLFDKGKVQIITKFAMESPGRPAAARMAEEAGGISQGAGAQSGPGTSATTIPQRYVAYLFDDVHTEFADLVRARDGADRHILATLSPVDRAAIFTTSGRSNQDFTEDRSKLHDALMRLQPHPVARTSGTQCPDVSFYMANVLVNQNDPQLMQALVADTIVCANLDGPQAPQQAQSMVQSTANQVYQSGMQETRVALTVIRDVVRRISAMPGQRMIVLASAGFVMPTDQRFEESDVVERAVRANVIINALDARGLYTVSPMGDISKPTYSAQASMMKSSYVTAEASASADVLAEMAAATGGQFVQNTNDLTAAFARLGSPPEFIYVLGFSPQNLKFDGSFHRLKVTLKNGTGFTLQARRGYYAPRRAEDPAETAKQEISDALFSQEEVRDLPVQLHTQFFKSSETEAKLAVLAHLDLQRMQFRKVDGRNNDEVTVVAALFDTNGNFLKGTEKKLTFHLLDETLARHLQSGVTVKTSFDVTPGSYLVRLVVREAEGQQMAAQSGTVEIP